MVTSSSHQSSIMRRAGRAISILFAIVLLGFSASMIWTGNPMPGAHFALLALALIAAELILGRPTHTPSKAMLVLGISAFWLQPVMLFSLVLWNVSGPYPLVAFYGTVFAIWVAPLLALVYLLRWNKANSDS
jgi:uncharacterized RDD family membrane protein YckC